MLKISNKQEKWRRLFYKNETQNLVFKTIKPILLKMRSKKIRQYLQNLTNQQYRKFSYTRTRNICILTGRSRSVYRFFRLSRLKIREYAKAGYFTGITKASW
jgi:ribosomal protein S14